MTNDTLTAIEGILVGHASLPGISTGCTIILPERGATAGVDVRGGAPGTFGTDTLNPLNLVNQVHGLFFSGGSAFGTSVAHGVRRYLRERGIGFDTGHGVVPIIAGGVIFDLGINDSGIYPDAELGYLACENASCDPVQEGSVGAGVGATVGKLFGGERAMKSGVGSVCIAGSGGLKVGALMVVNAFGDVLDPAINRSIAGSRKSPDSLELLPAETEIFKMTRFRGFPDGQSTVVGAVVTNAKLTKTQLTKVAQMAHNGLARTIFPVHTLYDGDAIFALSCGELEDVEVSIIGALASVATARAVLRGVRKAGSSCGLPSFSDLPSNHP
jgi:L-aminopeptidase/D-esterase-like protein